jgi:hypothetical protein
LNIFGLKERKELGVEQKIFFWPFKKATKRKRKIGPPLPPHKKNLVEKKYIVLPNLVLKVLFLL